MDLESIRRAPAKPGKIHRGLAAALGVDPAAISRLLTEERRSGAGEIGPLACYLEIKLSPAETSIAGARFGRRHPQIIDFGQEIFVHVPMHDA
ncbi:MAG: hypothetical protein NZ523_01850 [Elioraea sp.]|nr:hypothetical protein [Elioraea sp.]